MPRHVIVDGSNIATEGRTMPSLKQLNEAVTAFMQEFPDDVVTVVVDATFGHRIDPAEVAEFDEAVAHNELVAPPAGAIGRGDSFILSIANKTKGSILTNDSYQEFHGEYPWVFDEGRLIGGKPVPYVGWVFVLRTPVRGPVSRKSVKAGRSVDKNTGRVPRASKEASLPMPVPKAPPPGATAAKAARSSDTSNASGAPASGAGRGRRRGGGSAARDAAAAAPADVVTTAPSRPAPVRDEPVNELMAFIDFVEHHPVGSSVNAIVESYSSHGAYVGVGSVRGYVPLRLMSDPPARSARELGKVGDAVTLVVHSFTPARRSIDMAVPAAAVKDGVTPISVPVEPHAVETAAIAEAAVIASADADVAGPDRPVKPAKRAAKRAAKPATAEAGKRGSKRAAEAAPVATTADEVPDERAGDAVPTARPAKRAARKSPALAAADPAPVAEGPAAAGDAAPVAKARPAKRSARTAVTDAAPVAEGAGEAASVPVAKARPAKRAARTAVTAAAEAAEGSAAGAGEAASVPPSPAKKAPAKKAPAKKAPAKKAAAKKAPAAPAADTRATPAVGRRAKKPAPAAGQLPLDDAASTTDGSADGAPASADAAPKKVPAATKAAAKKRAASAATPRTRKAAADKPVAT